VVRGEICLDTSCLSCSQLYYDGNQKQALEVSSLAPPDPPCPPSDRLLNLLMMGLEFEAQKKRKNDSMVTAMSVDTMLGPGLGNYHNQRSPSLPCIVSHDQVIYCLVFCSLFDACPLNFRFGV